MEYRANFFDRVIDSISIVIKHFIALALPFIIYNMVVFVLIFVLIGALFVALILGTLIYGDSIIMGFLIISLLIIMLAIIGIPSFVMTLKSLENIKNGEKIKPFNNLKYAFIHIFSIIKIFCYFFSYVLLVPILVSILGFILTEVNSQFTFIINLLNIVVYLYFIIINGSKATISIYAAVARDNYSKEFFDQYKLISENKMMRIVGNNIGIIIVLYFVVYIITLIIRLILDSLNLDGGSIEYIMTLVIGLFFSIVILTFQYILYKRLEKEYVQTKKINKNISVTPNEGKL